MSDPKAFRPHNQAGKPRFVPANASKGTLNRLDPVLTRKKGVTAHPGILFMAAGGVLFAAYVFNFNGTQTFLDGFFNGIYQSSQTKEHTSAVESVFNGALPYLGAAFVAIVLLIVFSMMKRGMKSGIQSRKLKTREEVTLQGFCDEAREHQVGPKIAREAYKLLLPYCRGKMRARMDDNLMTDLKLTELQAADFYANLLMNTDRKQNPLAAEATLDTILGILIAVQHSPRRSVLQSAIMEVQAARPAAPGPRRMQVTAIPASPTKPVAIFVPPARLAKDPPVAGVPGPLA